MLLKTFIINPKRCTLRQIARFMTYHRAANTELRQVSELCAMLLSYCKKYIYDANGE